MIIFCGLGLACNWTSKEGLMIWRIPADILIGIGELSVLFQLWNYLPQWKRWLNFMGDQSYGIYLIHMNLETFLWVGMGFISSYWLRLFVVVAIACIIGMGFDITYNKISQRFTQKT